MAVFPADSTGKHQQGLSTDDKPLGVENGTTLHVIDTGEMFVFHDGMWEPDLRLMAALMAIQGGS